MSYTDDDYQQAKAEYMMWAYGGGHSYGKNLYQQMLEAKAMMESPSPQFVVNTKPALDAIEEVKAEMGGWMSRNEGKIAGRRYYNTMYVVEELRVVVVQVYYDDWSLRIVIGSNEEKYTEGTRVTRATRFLNAYLSGDAKDHIRDAMHADHYNQLCNVIAKGIDTWTSVYDKSAKVQWTTHPEPFHDMLQRVVPHPVSRVQWTISYIIQNLNDTHEWTREAIADWLDTLDEQPTYYPSFDETTTGIRNSAKLVRLEQTAPEGKS